MGIRRATKADQQALGVLWRRLLEEQAALDPRFAVADDALLRWHNDYPLWIHDEGQRLFLAEEGQRLLGFITAHRWVPPPIYAESAEVYVNELYVIPEKRREGIGSRLVEEVKQWATSWGAARVRIGTLAANEDGRAFWERQQAHAFSLELTLELDRPSSQPPAKGPGRIGF